MVVNGFSVVVLPKHNFTAGSETELFRHAPCVAGVYYAGFQRKEFGEMGALYRARKLPDDISGMYLRVRKYNGMGLYDYYVTDSWGDAKQMNAYLRSRGEFTEIIGLCSRQIEGYLGSHDFDGSQQFLGYDVDGGGYSLILTGLFERSELFIEELVMMNENGLLSKVEHVEGLVAKYVAMRGQGVIDEIDLESIDVISIYRLADSS